MTVFDGEVWLSGAQESIRGDQGGNAPGDLAAGNPLLAPGAPPTLRTIPFQTVPENSLQARINAVTGGPPPAEIRPIGNPGQFGRDGGLAAPLPRDGGDTGTTDTGQGGRSGPGAAGTGIAKGIADALMGLAMGLGPLGIAGSVLGFVGQTAAQQAQPDTPHSLLGFALDALGFGSESGVGMGSGADPGGGTSGTAGGEHGAEKGAATGTDASGIGVSGPTGGPSSMGAESGTSTGTGGGTGGLGAGADSGGSSAGSGRGGGTGSGTGEGGSERGYAQGGRVSGPRPSGPGDNRTIRARTNEFVLTDRATRLFGTELPELMNRVAEKGGNSEHAAMALALGMLHHMGYRLEEHPGNPFEKRRITKK